MESGNTEYEEGTSISSQNLSMNLRHRLKHKDCGHTGYKAGDESSRASNRQLHMTEKYLIVKMAPFGVRYCMLPQATIGEIEPGRRNNLKNRFGLSQARVKMGMKTRAKKGLWHGGIPTYGYKYDRTAGKIVRHPGEAEVVRLIFGKYLELKSCFKVRDYLNELGSRKRDSSKWDVLRIRNVLRRRVHAGWLISSGVEVFDTSIQMVPEETFVAVQKLLTEERTCPDPVEVIAQSGGVLRVMQHQFSNKAEYEACPECGRRSTVKRQGKSRKGLLIFNCVACERWFIEGLGSSPIPPCPICLKTSNVQRGRRFISDARIPFRTYWCRGCGARFRVQDHLNTNS